MMMFNAQAPAAWNWLSGPLDAEAILFGAVPAFWIARIGKLLLFYAGSVIIAVVLGPERIKRLHESLNRTLPNLRTRFARARELVSIPFHVLQSGRLRKYFLIVTIAWISIALAYSTWTDSKGTWGSSEDWLGMWMDFRVTGNRVGDAVFLLLVVAVATGVIGWAMFLYVIAMVYILFAVTLGPVYLLLHVGQAIAAQVVKVLERQELERAWLWSAAVAWGVGSAIDLLFS